MSDEWKNMSQEGQMSSRVQDNHRAARYANMASSSIEFFKSELAEVVVRHEGHSVIVKR